VNNRARFEEAERVRREREQFERDRAAIQLRANATPETLRHKQAAVVDTLWFAGKLTNEQHRAAREIDGVFHALTSALGCKLMSWEKRIPGSASADDRLVRMIGMYRRYSEWRSDAGTVKQLRATACVADIVFDVIVSNLGINQAGQLWGMDQRRVLAVVREALYRYAEISGWLDPSKTGAAPGLS
jgi:hypothetical protein